VPWNRRGAATSSGQFFRTIGGAIAVAAFGAVVNANLHARLGPAFNANSGLDPTLRARLSPDAMDRFQSALAGSLHVVFLVCAGLALVGLVIGLFFPRGSAAEHAHHEILPETALES
jgi:hypothetical protein